MGTTGREQKPAKAPVVLRKKSLWVHWNPASSQVSVAEYLDTHAEVRLPTLVMKPQMAFAMQVRVDNGFMHVKMEREDLMEADLEPLAEDHDAFEDTTEVSFIKLAKDRVRFLLACLLARLRTNNISVSASRSISSSGLSSEDSTVVALLPIIL